MDGPLGGLCGSVSGPNYMKRRTVCASPRSPDPSASNEMCRSDFSFLPQRGVFTGLDPPAVKQWSSGQLASTQTSGHGAAILDGRDWGQGREEARDSRFCSVLRTGRVYAQPARRGPRYAHCSSPTFTFLLFCW
uniref:Uncharacterized protein n=1 Tax=Knipowitschia caucasica TaxID=637954 RepID=A0AAV2KCI4_KNICA